MKKTAITYTFVLFAFIGQAQQWQHFYFQLKFEPDSMLRVKDLDFSFLQCPKTYKDTAIIDTVGNRAIIFGLCQGEIPFLRIGYRKQYMWIDPCQDCWDSNLVFAVGWHAMYRIGCENGWGGYAAGIMETKPEKAVLNCKKMKVLKKKFR